MPASDEPTAGELAERVKKLGQQIEWVAREGGSKLRATVAQNSKAVADLATEVGQLRQLVEDIAAGLADLQEEAADERLAQKSWFDITDAREALARLVSLDGWIDRVFRHYVFRKEELPACWRWHPDAVEELLWLQRLHREAYHGKTKSTLRAADWHDRYLPSTRTRLRERAGRCAGLGEHGPDGKATVDPPKKSGLVDTREAIATWWATNRDGVPPFPTADNEAEVEGRRPVQ